jgi:large subunit ribosomal protein L13
MTTIHTIDAENKTLGFISSSVAKILMGKNRSDYVPNKVADVLVIIENASKTKMSERRLKETIHESYSGYPGGFKSINNEKIIKNKGWKSLYELSIYGMLPANKLRPLMMKRLKIKE